MNETISAGPPLSASVLWDMSMKRYDVYRGHYEALAGRSVAFIAAAQALIAAHAFALGKLAVLGRLTVAVSASLSTMLYLGSTIGGLLAIRNRKIGTLPNPMGTNLMSHVTLAKDDFLLWVVEHYLEPGVIAPLRKTYLIRERAYTMALYFVIAQAAWLFCVTIMPLCVGARP